MFDRLLKIIMLQILIGLFLFLNACTFTHTVAKDFEIPSKNLNKVPIKIGLYIQLDYCSYTITKYHFGDKHVFQVGEALCYGMGKMIKGAFNEVITLESLDSDAAKRIQVIVIPEIVSVSVIYPAWTFQNADAFITIKYTFTDLNKKVIWLDTFQGKDRRKLGTAFTAYENMRKCVQFAVEDHFRKALDGILSSKWWGSKAVRHEK